FHRANLVSCRLTGFFPCSGESRLAQISGLVLKALELKEIVTMGFATNAIHVGQEPDSATGAIVLPIYQTSTYVQDEIGKDKGFDYARTNHPNRKALERTLAKLEGGHSAYAFSSGMAAIDGLSPSAPWRPRRTL